MANTQQDILSLRAKAEAGDASAQNSLGCAYHNADGVARDYEKAMEWYLKAASQGEKYAEDNIGKLYRYGLGVAKDLKIALEWFLRAAEHGLASAQETVGIFYHFGYGTNKDKERAVYWYRKAVAKNQSLAQNNLGSCYQNGEGVPKDYEQAFYWYQRAAINGSDYGACNLAILYEEGKGTKQDYALAKHWYEIALKRKHQRAQKRLDDLLQRYDPNMDRWIFTSSLYVDNPFRIMGLFTNASDREIVSNKGRMEAFAKVGKSISFDLDSIAQGLHKRMYPREMSLFGLELPTPYELELTEKPIDELYRGIKTLERSICSLKSEEIYKDAIRKDKDELSEKEKRTIEFVEKSVKELNDYRHAYDEKRQVMLTPSRSQERVSVASNLLADVRTKLKYAFFWYCKITKEDEYAISCLIDSNKQQAKDIWHKSFNFSALLNLAALAFDEEDYYNFVEYISRVIHDDERRKEFVSSVCGKDFCITEGELARIFIDALMTEGPNADWLSAFRERGSDAADDEYIEDIMANEPISIIENEIEKISHFKSRESKEWLEILQRLQFIADQQLSFLVDYLGANNSKYVRISDKIAEQLLDSTQAYHRACSHSDFEVTYKCVELSECALRYACSSVVKEGIRSAVEEIKRIKDKLPSRQVFDSISLIRKKKAEYSEKKESVDIAICFISECATILVELKSELGKQDKEYQRLSTEVAEYALNITIGQFNREWKAFSNLVERYDNTYKSVLTVPTVKLALENLRGMLAKCCQLFANLDLLDVSKDWESRYARNKAAILKDAVEAGVTTSCKPTIDMRSEQEIFSEARTLSQIQEYLRRFGQTKAKYYKQACDKIKSLEEEDDDFWTKTRHSHDYSLYLRNYPNGRHSKEAKEMLAKLQEEEKAKKDAEDNQYWEMSKQHKTYKAYLTKYPKGLHAKEAEELLRQGNSAFETVKDVGAIIVLVSSIITFCYLIF